MKLRKLLVWLVLAIGLVVSVSACSPTPPPTPTATVVPEPTTPVATPTFDWLEILPGWQKIPLEERPWVVEGHKVCYVRVHDNTYLRKISGYNDQGYPILVISQNPYFGGTNIHQRTLAREGTEIMVWADGKVYSGFDWIDPDSKQCRPYDADGHLVSYEITPYNRIDGKDLREHPDMPLYIRVIHVDAEFVQPNN